jgi:hypothetical protein
MFISETTKQQDAGMFVSLFTCVSYCLQLIYSTAAFQAALPAEFRIYRVLQKELKKFESLYKFI